MRSRKVFKILTTLSGDDRKSFGRFLDSPYLNSNGRIVRFYSILEDKMLDTPEINLSPEQIWEMGLSKGPFHRNGFDKICAELLAALNDFMGLELYRSRETTRIADQFEAYVERGLDEWNESFFRFTQARLKDELDRHPEGLLAKITLAREYCAYIFRQPRTPRGEHLLDIDNALTQYFLARKLELASALMNYNKVFASDLALPDLDWMQAKIEAHFDEYPALIRLQYLLFTFSTNPTDELYHRLKAELAKNEGEIAQDDTSDMHKVLLNYCFLKLNEGSEAFVQETDDLLMALLEKKIILENDKMRPVYFKNIVSLRLRRGEIEWVESFIEAWKHKLSDEQEGFAVLFNQSVLAYFQQDYRTCIQGMEEVLRDFKADVFYGLDARIYIIKSLFERNNPDDALELESRLNSLRVLLIRDKKLAEVDKGHYKQFVKNCLKLMAIRTELPEKRTPKLKKFLSGLSKSAIISNRDWFEKMATDLMNA